MNHYVPHLLVLPEDQANIELINGFILNDRIRNERIQVLPPARGWRHVIDMFEREYVRSMRRYSDQVVLLLIDFDKQEDRMEYIKSRIPADLHDRVFVLGSWSEPEILRGELKLSYEEIGDQIARECVEGETMIWQNDLLAHNGDEISRLSASMKGHLLRVQDDI